MMALTVVTEPVWSTYVGTLVATWADCTAYANRRNIVARRVEPILGDVVREVNVFARRHVAGC
jgi:hypothetical protein